MKLTGELKRKVEAAENRDEARKVIAQAGMELTDDELDAVSGGGDTPATRDYGIFYCPYCKIDHSMWRWHPVCSPVIQSRSYPNSTMFQCDWNSRFYQVTKGGETMYFSNTGKQL